MAKKTRSRPSTSQNLPITAYRISDLALEIVTADQHREWMDHVPERFAYRCLPLLIANQAGWDLLCPTGFSARWSGKPGLDSIKFKWDEGPHEAIASHFGNGVLTFIPGYLFRTAKDHNMWARGCPNRPKDGISPLDGIIETDWAPFTFTMNWMITRPKQWIRFEKGEPICRILPFPRHYLESVQPRVQEMASDRRVMNEYNNWRDSRAQFIEDLSARKEEVVEQGWQRTYVLGQNPQGVKMKEHQTKLRLRDFLPFKK